MRHTFVILILAILTGCGYNGAVSNEAGVKAAWENNMNIRDNMVKQIGEAMHIAETERESLGEVISAYMSAQSPGEGRGQMMQWTQHAGVQVDGDTFERVIDIMESKRNEFQNGQTDLRDRQRVYEAQLNSLPNGPVLKMMGYPSPLAGCGFNSDYSASAPSPYCPPIDKDRDGVASVLDFPVIVSGSTKAVFASGEDDWTLGDE